MEYRMLIRINSRKGVAPLAIGAALCLLFACRNSTTPRSVTYILPNDTLGHWKIITNCDRLAQSIPATGPIVINVPMDGVVCVNDESYLRAFHKVTAQYQNGTIIPNSVSQSNSKVKLFLLGNVAYNNNAPADWFLIGTDEEYQLWLEERKEPKPGLRQIADGVNNE